MKNIPYLDWNKKIKNHTPDNMRIGDDLLIIEGQHLPDIAVGPQIVDMSSTIMIDKGWSRLMIGMNEYLAEAPSLIFIRPDCIYQSLEVSEDLSCRVVVMSKTFTAGLFRGYGPMEELMPLINKDPVMNLAGSVRTFDTYYKILRSIVSSPLGLFKLESARHLTLSMLYSFVNVVTREVAARNRQDKIYAEFQDDLKKFYRIQRDVAFYAGRRGITPKYLSQIVKDKTGHTVSDCIDEMVVTECKALLLSTDLTIRQISISFRFPSQSVFGKYFKRLTGMSPSDYRNLSNKQVTSI